MQGQRSHGSSRCGLEDLMWMVSCGRRMNMVFLVSMRLMMTLHSTTTRIQLSQQFHKRERKNPKENENWLGSEDRREKKGENYQSQRSPSPPPKTLRLQTSPPHPNHLQRPPIQRIESRAETFLLAITVVPLFTLE